MTKIIAESFDFWPNFAAMVPKWIATPSGLLQTGPATQFGTGQCVSGFSGSVNFSANESTIFGSIRLKYNTATTNSANVVSLTFNDVSSNQCCVQIRGDGSIVTRSGGTSGTILATTNSVFNINEWVSFQFKIVFGTSGTIEIRVNGSTVNAVFDSGDTASGTANDYANRLVIACQSTWYADDLMLVNNDGTAPSGWLGDIRCVPQLIANTSQAQFTKVLPISRTGVVAVTTNQALAANTIYARNYIISRHGLVANGVVNFNTNAIGNFIMAIYDNNANSSPGNLIVQSDVYVNPTSGNNIFNFGSNTQLYSNQAVWLALYGSNSSTVQCQGSTTVNRYTNIFDYSNTAPLYSPDNFPNALSVKAITMSIDYTQNNSSAVSEPTYDSDTSYVYTSNVGAKDIYQMSPLTAAPANIVGVSYYTVVRKTDAGARAFEFIVNHGGTELVVANSSALGTTYNIYEAFMTKQTDGASALTVSALDSALIGPKLSA